MSNGRHSFRPALCGIFCVLWVSLAQAQTTGFLRVLVTDLGGTPLAGVTVSVTSGDQATRARGGVTDASGALQIPSLPPGWHYEVRVSFPGLATVILSEVEVAAGHARTLKVLLQPETDLRERVEVRAALPVINPESPTTETRFSSEFIDALPILGRNYQDILTLAPGVTDVDGDGNPNIHGARDTNVVTLLDGIETNDPLTGKVGVQLNLESIQAIEVKTAGASAEFGRAQGGFTNIITRSGGNDFEGTFKFFWRGSLVDGDGAGIDDPRLHAGVGESGLRDITFNDFLPFLSVGGPIVKDRAWFFVALEYIQREDPVNALSAAFVTGVREHREFAKATWQVSPNHRLALSINYDPQEFLNQGLNSFTREESGFTLEQGGLLLALKEVSVFSPSVALETSIAHFEGKPDLLPNLGLDTNGNGLTYIDRDDDGFLSARERDPGEDYDSDGRFDIFEDTFILNGKLDEMEIDDPDDPMASIIISEDQDGDGRLTPPGGCEGNLREDTDCDGHLDNVFEDENLNGRLDRGEDLDLDGRLDDGTEDRNGDGELNDTSFPEGLYPYGRLRPETIDRDYTIQQSRGIVSGPYFEEFSDRRTRVTLRQDLSVFIPDFRGSHDLKIGYVLARETFNRRTEARAIILERDEVPPTCFDSGGGGQECLGGIPPSLVALLPVERTVDAAATGRSAGLYVQDTYKPLPNLSIGIGIRFDRETADASGYTPFDPRVETAGTDRVFALGGAERGRDDATQGNGDGIDSNGFFTDPLFADRTTTLNQVTGGLVDAVRLAGLSRLTRHRSEVGFSLGPLASLFPDIVLPGGDVDFNQLRELGFSFQQPEAIAITNDNLAPRLSVSWDPWSDGRTKLFAAWGRYYDKLFLNTIVGEEAPERLARYYLRDPTGIDVTMTRPRPGSRPVVLDVTPNHHVGQSLSRAPPSVTQVDRGLQTPWSDEFTIGFEREIAPEVAFSIRFISRKFRNQLQDIDINHGLRLLPNGEPVDLIGILVQGLNEVVPNDPKPDGRPDLYIRNFFFNQVLRVGNFNEARYRAIEVEVLRRLSRRWQLQASYTYSRAQGSAEDFQSRLGNDPSTVESEFGYLDFDQRHVVKLNATTFVPGDWQLGFAASWASGLPYSVISRFFALDNVGYEQFRTRFGFTGREPGGEFRFNGLRRNSERNAAVLDLNVRAKKSFVIGRTSAALILEVFNVLNSDDLHIFTFEPNRGGGTVAGSPSVAATPLELDASRRFGRRFQVGFAFAF